MSKKQSTKSFDQLYKEDQRRLSRVPAERRGTVTVSVKLIGSQFEGPSSLGTEPVKFIIRNGQLFEKPFQEDPTRRIGIVDNSISKLRQITSDVEVLEILSDRWRRIAPKKEQRIASWILGRVADIEKLRNGFSYREAETVSALILEAMDLGGAITRAGLWPDVIRGIKQTTRQNRLSRLGAEKKAKTKDELANRAARFRAEHPDKPKRWCAIEFRKRIETAKEPRIPAVKTIQGYLTTNSVRKP